MALLLYGDVGLDFTARSVAEHVNSTKGHIHVRISSGGGSAFDGLTIYNVLSAAKAAGRQVTVDIDGLAASAASVVAMAGSPVRMSEAALAMTHNSMTGKFGHAPDLREAADVLDKLDGALAATYARKSGRPIEQIRQMMSHDNWMSAAEAKEAGLVDEITTAMPVAAQVLSARSYAQLPERVKTNLQALSEKATVGAGSQKSGMTPEQLNQILDALASVTARLEKLEAPVVAAAPPAPEPEIDEPAIEVEEPVADAGVADARAALAEIVAVAADEFIAAGKLTPAGREMFVRASATADGFKATCSYFRSLPSPVATSSNAPGSLPASKDDDDGKVVLNEQQKAWAARARIDTSKFAKDSK